VLSRGSAPGSSRRASTAWLSRAPSARARTNQALGAKVRASFLGQPPPVRWIDRLQELDRPRESVRRKSLAQGFCESGPKTGNRPATPSASFVPYFRATSEAALSRSCIGEPCRETAIVDEGQTSNGNPDRRSVVGLRQPLARGLNRQQAERHGNIRADYSGAFPPGAFRYSPIVPNRPPRMIKRELINI